MTILHPRLFLAICGAACLIAFTPEGRRPPAELAAIDESAIGSSARARRRAAALASGRRRSRGAAGACRAAERRRRSASTTPVPCAGAPLVRHPSSAARGSVERRGPRGPIRRCGPPGPGAAARGRPQLGLLRPSGTRRQARRRRPRRLPRATPTSRPNSLMPTSQAPAPAVSALSAIAPSPPAAAPAPTRPRRRRLRSVRRPRSSTIGATSRAWRRSPRRRTTRPSDRRWNGRPCAPTPIRPSRRSPPSSRPIRPGQAAAGFATGEEAELAAHPEAPAKVAEFFAGGPPQTSAGKIAAARAAKATGRSDEAAQIIRALWRDGNFDALTESVILRDFGASLAQGRSQISRRPPDLRRLRRRRHARRGACRSRRSGAGRGSHRGRSRADERRAAEGCSPGAPRRSWPVVFQGPVRPSRRPRL